MKAPHKYSLIVKTFLFQAIQFSQIQFSISKLLVLFNRARVDLAIRGCSTFTGNSPWDCLVSYPGHSLGGVLPFCRGAVGVFYSLSWLGKVLLVLYNNKWNHLTEQITLLVWAILETTSLCANKSKTRRYTNSF